MPPQDRLVTYSVQLHNITAAVIVSPDGVVVDCAPVFRRFMGASFGKFRTWVEQRRGKIHRLPERSAKEDNHAGTL
jgi:hypothetical protein